MGLAAAEELNVVSFEEFLARELRQERRHEFVGGRVYLMAGGTERHDLLTSLIYEALCRGARANGCRPFVANRLLRTPAGASYYPDVLIACGPAANKHYETDAALLVEVRSPSTADVDRREKLISYTLLPSLGLYLLADPDSPRVEVATHTGDGQTTWTVYGPGAVIPTRYGDLDLDEIYAVLEATATT